MIELNHVYKGGKNDMKKISMILCITAALFLLTVSCSSEKPEQTAETRTAEVAKPAVKTAPAAVPVSAAESGGDGEALFQKYCIQCHKNGGNIIKPEKTIRRKDLAAKNMDTPEDIINIMRNPGKGMMKFSEEKVSDRDAQKIAEYILNTFK